MPLLIAFLGGSGLGGLIGFGAGGGVSGLSQLIKWGIIGVGVWFLNKQLKIIK
jgi:hypothetical protein